MTDDTPTELQKAAKARQGGFRLARHRLRVQAAEHPDQIKRLEARIALLTAAEKRQREKDRIDHLVLGAPRKISKPVKSKKQGRRRVVAKAAPIPLAPGLNEVMEARERWSHKEASGAHPETLDHAVERHHQGALAQLVGNGTIDAEQLEWAAQISNVHRSIESDVGVSIASLEGRVDNGGRGRHVAESVRRVRFHQAYGRWREMLPAPKQMVLDMIVGDTIGYTVAAKRYGVHNRRAKRLLIEALDRWPGCLDWAYRTISDEDICRAEAAE